MKIPVVWLSLHPETPARGYWDHAFLEDLLDGKLWSLNPPYEAVHQEGFGGLVGGAIVVIPARSHVDDIDEINELLVALPWVLLILTGDEESNFPCEKLNHPRMKLWVMSARPVRHRPARFLGSGYQPAFRLLKGAPLPERTADWVFAGQVTHERRQLCIDNLKAMSRGLVGDLLETPGFTQGVSSEEYVQKMCSSRVAPCPSGPETPDTFRLYEALESGCVPVADTRSPSEDFGINFWDLTFGTEVPFPVVGEAGDWEPGVGQALQGGRRLANKVSAWWMVQKRDMAYRLVGDLSYLGAPLPVPDVDSQITVLIPSSPIPSHPSTAILDETISTIRSHLPRCEIFVLLDGVREEQADRTSDYEKYTEEVIWKAHHHWENVLPVVFEEHLHQNGTALVALESVRTPTILYVEHDAPLTPDCSIPWDRLVRAIQGGAADVVRFHHESEIHPEHRYLMIGDVTDVEGVPLTRTLQWSQRPHLASSDFYRSMLRDFFTEKSKTMIEDVMHSKAQVIGAERGWTSFRLWMYTPEGNLKRSYHLDGRGEDSKFDMVF